MWSEETVSELRKLWAAGKSYGEIASQLPGNISRCAVGGKLFRMGLARSEMRVRHQRKAKPPKPPRQSLNLGNSRRITGHYKPVFPTAAEPLPAPMAEDIGRVQFLDLDDTHCRWPAAEPHTGFCGCPKLPGTSYCAGHAARAYRPYTVAQRAFPTLGISVSALQAVEEFTA